MIVVDTNVLSEIMRASPSRAVLEWLGEHRGRLRMTAISVAEIRYGVARLPPGRRKDLLASAAEEIFASYGAQILAFDGPAATAYAALVSDRERLGRPIDGFDAQIAAICRTRRATLATRNVRDFADTGIEIVDPWSAG